jgi:hypothetical protein
MTEELTFGRGNLYVVLPDGSEKLVTQLEELVVGGGTARGLMGTLPIVFDDVRQRPEGMSRQVWRASQRRRT